MRLKRKFKVRDTGTYGKGCYATEHIRERELIHTMNGRTVSLSEMVRNVNNGKEYIDDPLQVGRRTYIDLDETSRSFNHSCLPNAGIRGRNSLISIRTIQPGEEITYDYSLTIAPTAWKMKCRCGSTICRKTLGDITSIPRARLSWYERNGALQDYIRKIIPDIKSGSYSIPAYEQRALTALGANKFHV